MSQLRSRDGTPTAPKTAGTTPGPSSNRKRSITPPTIMGVTMPRKIADFTIEEPFTSRRIKASQSPKNREIGRVNRRRVRDHALVVSESRCSLRSHEAQINGLENRVYDEENHEDKGRG